MLFAFRSLVIAVKAIVLNLLSVAAAYGVLVLVFQHGVGKGLLGFSSTAGIDAGGAAAAVRDPVRPLDGLPRVHPQPDPRAVHRGATMDEAISDGIKSTAGVVTSAAVVMVGVFSVFATLSMLFFKQFGVGLAAAILIDATIVRGVLLPATMKLLGDRNWYLPRWLEWLPQLDDGEPELELRGRARAARPSRSRPATRRGSARSRPAGSRGSCSSGSSRSVSPTSGSPATTGLRARRARRPAQLTLHPCTTTRRTAAIAADCGTLVVPENRADPQSRLIALPVTRIRARSATPPRRSSASRAARV